MSVFRSNKNIYVQLIDDVNGRTLVSASSRVKEIRQIQGNKTQIAAEVGKLIAQRALKAGITAVVFDRNGYLYHGRVKALAEAARQNGLKF
jgi:large subunit ribosomal protein L18